MVSESAVGDVQSTLQSTVTEAGVDRQGLEDATSEGVLPLSDVRRADRPADSPVPREQRVGEHTDAGDAGGQASHPETQHGVVFAPLL